MFNGIEVEAGRISFADSTVRAEGDVSIASGDFYARCGEVECDTASKDISAREVNLAIGEVYISSERAKFSQEQIAVDGAHVGVNLGLAGVVPQLDAKAITYDRAKKWAVARNVRLKIGKVPIMGLPYLALGDWVRYMDMRLDAGHTSRLGAYARSEICYNIYENLSLGALLDVYGKRGVLLGPVLKIDAEGECVQGQAQLRSGFIADRGDRGKDVDGEEISKRRWFIDGRQNYHFEQRIDVISDFLWASDGRIERDFRPDWCEEWDVRDSFGELDYRGRNDLWTAFTRVKMNRYQTFPQQIPSLRYERFPTEIFDSDCYYFGYIDVSRQRWKRKKMANSGQRKAIELNRLDSYWGIHRPTELASGINFTPLVGGKWTHYGGEGDRLLGELGFDFGANFYGIYPQRVACLRAKEWRHTLRPIVKYRYISPASKRTAKPIDGKRKNDFLPCIDLAEMRHVDDLRERSVLRLGLENDCFAKSEKGKFRKIASLDFYQDFRFRRPLDSDSEREKTLSDFYIFSTFSPRHWLDFGLYSRVNWRKFSVPEVNGEVNFISGDLWRLGLGARFLQHRFNQFNVNFCFQFNDISSINLGAQIDAKRGKFLAFEVGYKTRWAGVWDVQIFCKIKNRSSRDSRFQPGFAIDLMRW
ncbi:MAG: hypothetical protein LBJ81_01955 [Puniceicoccales bacterium]|jgi:hypothetical protein|nr:hypothetical protein [Puniceicoccales bacterium]